MRQKVDKNLTAVEEDRLKMFKESSETTAEKIGQINQILQKATEQATQFSVQIKKAQENTKIEADHYELDCKDETMRQQKQIERKMQQEWNLKKQEFER